MIERIEAEDEGRLRRLLAQRVFLERLAVRLTRDDDAAQDLVQDTWLVALERAPRRSVSLRAWLGAIVRNAAWKRRRSETRRRRIEEIGARREALSDVARVAEQRALEQAVHAAILALHEPYRSAVLLRYLDGLPPRAIAQQLGAPLETVKARLKRGLAILRRDLDERRRPPRTTWRAAFAIPLARWQAVLRGPSRAAGFLAASGAVLLLCALLAIRGRFEPPPAERASAIAALASAEREGVLHTPTSTAVLRHTAIAPTLAPSSSTAAPEARTGALSVRVLWERDGSAAENISVRAVAWGGADPLLHTARARSDGAGLVRFDGLAAGRVVLTADRGGRAVIELAPGSALRAELRVPRGNDVHGQVLSPHGAPVAGARIWLSEPRDACEGTFAALSDARGEFALASVAPSCWIGARAPCYAPSPLFAAPAERGDAVQVTLQLGEAGGDVEGRVCAAAGEPIAGALVLLDTGAPELPHEAQGAKWTTAPPFAVATDAGGRFHAPGLPAGRVRVFARAPEHGPYEGEAIVPAGSAARLEIALPRGATLRGSVRDPYGRPHARAVVGVGSSRFFLAFTSSRETFLASVVRSEEDGSFELRGLASGPALAWTSILSGERVEATLALLPGAVAEWEPIVSEPTSRGRLCDSRGEALTGWIVEPVIAAEESCVTQLPTTDAEGRFILPVPPEQLVGLALREPKSRRICARPLAWPSSGGEAQFVVPEEALPSAHLYGRVCDASGNPITTARVRAVRPGEEALPAATVDERGRFRIGPLPPDAYRLAVEAPDLRAAELDLRALAPREERDVGSLALTAR